MAAGKRRSPRRVNPWFVAIPLVLVGAGIAFFALRGGDDKKTAPKPKPTEAPPFAFATESVEFIPIERGVIPENGDELAAEVTTVMSDVYDAGWVSSKRWENGAFSAVLTHFDEKAAAQAQVDLPQLTLGPEANQLESVKPGPNALSISFLVREKQAVAAIAKASFEGAGTLRDGGQLALTHAGTYYLHLAGGEWRIVGYRVKGSLDSAGASTPTPEPTA